MKVLDRARRYEYLLGHLEGSANREDGEILLDGYAARSKAIAERRAVFAGYRSLIYCPKYFDNQGFGSRSPGAIEVVLTSTSSTMNSALSAEFARLL
ncbi:MAG: hypothetical protein M3410_08265 [Acidobacteriota bacterium]|nr:hypothetical protein [Acidobacteriota bacterium]